MTIRGEDIINEPCLNLEKICRWLNLSWDESISAALLRPQDSSYASYGPYGTHLGLDPHFLRAPTFEAHKMTGVVKLKGPLSWRNDDKGFIPEVLQMAQEFGYE
ncbi:MAG: sulfotransferase [Microcoleus sp. SIO2G3]|nr:sulfotransferase [Microcoleus sp. SIO2G3]